MYIVFIILFMTLLTYNTMPMHGSDAEDQARQRAAVVALQMEHYHSLALQKCWPTGTDAHPIANKCAVGIVTPDPIEMGQTVSYETTFTSVTDGQWMVTYWTPDQIDMDYPVNMAGLVANDIKNNTWDTVHAGIYNAETQRFGSVPGALPLPLTGNYGGVEIPDGAVVQETEVDYRY
ncbi:hypothetical protein [Acetobacter persici]|uniref:Uncharacterized protein n=1 Tax=Acetobacter persici TaxID=1076596 RepID=A0A1U9LJF8_9PROT|nr:hypothetical protein [Acetobacter persici]AQT06593.1 hypothetical protein A0U91_16425 [Acetobacter persici]